MAVDVRELLQQALEGKLPGALSGQRAAAMMQMAQFAAACKRVTEHVHASEMDARLTQIDRAGGLVMSVAGSNVPGKVFITAYVPKETPYGQ